jgi:hypothetical protein
MRRIVKSVLDAMPHTTPLRRMRHIRRGGYRGSARTYRPHCWHVGFVRSARARSCATASEYAAAAIQARGCALRRVAVAVVSRTALRALWAVLRGRPLPVSGTEPTRQRCRSAGKIPPALPPAALDR